MSEPDDKQSEHSDNCKSCHANPHGVSSLATLPYLKKLVLSSMLVQQWFSHQGNKGLWCKAPTGSSHHGSEPNHMRKKVASANQLPVQLALRHMASTALYFISDF